MATELDDRQTVPMMTNDRRQLRQLAADFDVSPGLLARALILVGFDRITDPAVSERIQAERDATRARSAEAGRTAMRARYGKDKHTS